MSRMWPMGYVVRGCRNYLIQEQRALNIMLQMNFAKIEKRLLAYYCSHDVQCTWEVYNKLFGRTKMIKFSTGVEISEDTVISALKKVGISVELKHVLKLVM